MRTQREKALAVIFRQAVTERWDYDKLKEATDLSGAALYEAYHDFIEQERDLSE